MPKKKTKETQSAKPEAPPRPISSVSTTRTLFDVALEEPRRRELAEFSDVINVLRNDKNFTFREIAKWLYEHTGFQADHNAVYREYIRGIPPEAAQTEAMADEATEMEEYGNQ